MIIAVSHTRRTWQPCEEGGRDAGAALTLGKGGERSPIAIARMSETHELAVGNRPAPCPTKTDDWREVEEIWTALVAPLMFESVELMFEIITCARSSACPAS